jgi:CRP/FNR family cyclic AMP-dependent transcriptional regulator
MMVRPALLKHYPIFSLLNAKQLKTLSKVAKEETYGAGEIIFKEGQPAEALSILLKGAIDLFFTVEVEYHPELTKELHFGTIIPGEVFGVSALIEPYILTSSGRTTRACQVIHVDALKLHEILLEDQDLAYGVIQEIAKIALERLNRTRVQLAAANLPTLVS